MNAVAKNSPQCGILAGDRSVHAKMVVRYRRPGPRPGQELGLTLTASSVTHTCASRHLVQHWLVHWYSIQCCSKFQLLFNNGIDTTAAAIKTAEIQLARLVTMVIGHAWTFKHFGLRLGRGASVHIRCGNVLWIHLAKWVNSISAMEHSCQLCD